eukprot:TRINITY_DN1793_c0_g1_i4.p1 TRINITY_DN1793_c0_g1~~TRINITY_DN1793_c0_g1_i4.p1  ORF type:complete len:221 (+),score=45.64 TRINITY_DN1793_c0_g1_i4:205-867(+)
MGKGRAPGVGDKGKGTKAEEYLNSILPPREFTKDGKLYVQYVSATPSTKAEVITLQENLDKKLQQRKARETGICPIREELYAQCFDELIRQITIQCIERGFLLVRVRDELRMTIEAYQSLYESAIAYGMRKALLAEQRKNDMNSEIQKLERECSELQKSVDSYEKQIKDIEESFTEECDKLEKKHKETVEIEKTKNRLLKEDLQRLLSAQPSQDKAKAKK